MAPRRHHIGASRRTRREEEGEDEGSISGELEDDSLSEASGISHQEDDDADGEGSDDSDDEVSIPPQGADTNGHPINGRMPEAGQQSRRFHSASPDKRAATHAISDTEAMMNGMKISGEADEAVEIHFDQMKRETSQPTGRTPSAEPRRETFAERKRREHEKYSKERDENPAFVPTRGSFFLHDKRSTESMANGHKPSSKSKSRPYGLIVDGNVRK